ncbi:MAG: hypothetical protein L3J83_08250 [Proteobacteria bacterium]|nr:hypothetical protein [Pseudomonadota bacterium]
MRIFTLLLILLMSSTPLLAKLPSLDVIHELPAIDVAFEMNKSLQNTSKAQPLQFAIPTKVSSVFVKHGAGKGGQWDQLKDSSWVWRFEVYAQNALSLDFGLFDFYMPPTAQLSFYDQTGELVKGPFTDQKNKPHKQFWPGTIIGDSVTVELTVANKYKRFVSFSIKNINRGFRSIWDDVDFIPKMGQQKFWENSSDIVSTKTQVGSCNVDVVCDDGDEWRNEIRSVARYTISGSGLCTGQMINNTANDGKPLFLTANHCGFNSSTDASINIWWNYESSQCRAPDSDSSGSPISISSFNDTQSGSTFLASYELSDFAILELDDLPSPSYQVFYTGWDRRDIAPFSATSIHHPRGHAKRISIDNDATSITIFGSSTPSLMSHIRVADWDVGTTEGGSSGSGLWNSDKLLVGQLHGGAAACGNDDPDWYGRLYMSWEGGETANSRLKDWLDPTNTGVQTLQGLGECSPMTVSIAHTSSSEEIGIIQNFSASVSGGVAPYTYSWDINADGGSDGNNSSITATYAQQFVGNVNVGITDAEGCTSGSTKAVVIQAPEIIRFDLSSPVPPPVQICGNSDNFIDPGERWEMPVTLQNNGFADATNAYAVFTKNADSGSFEVVAGDNFGKTLGACDKQFISSFSSFITQTASFEILEAIEDSTVYELSYHTLTKLYRESIKFEKLGRILAEKNYLCVLDRAFTMQTKTAKQKYLDFIKTYDKKIIQRVPQHQIASFLGIAPESLSRVRKEISTS